VDTLVRDIIVITAESFAQADPATDFGDSGLTLEFAGGGSATLAFSPPDANGRRLVRVFGLGTDLTYRISGWAHDRLFPPPEAFGL